MRWAASVCALVAPLEQQPPACYKCAICTAVYVRPAAQAFGLLGLAARPAACLRGHRPAHHHAWPWLCPLLVAFRAGAAAPPSAAPSQPREPWHTHGAHPCTRAWLIDEKCTRGLPIPSRMVAPLHRAYLAPQPLAPPRRGDVAACTPAAPAALHRDRGSDHLRHFPAGGLGCTSCNGEILRSGDTSQLLLARD